MSFVGGMYSANRSWAGALYHQNSIAEDRLRLKGIALYASINLSYYPEENQQGSQAVDDSTDGLDFNIEGFGFLPKAEIRLFGSPFFVGLEYLFFSNEVAFDSDAPDLSDLAAETRVAGVGTSLRFEDLDNSFTPNRGLRATTTYRHFDTFFGGTERYGLLAFDAAGYINPLDWLVLGLRLDGQWVFDNPPFYALPFVSLRGAPALRYQGERVLVVETEERIDFTRRWSLVVFGGYGRPSFFFEESSFHRDVFAGGAGFRYLLARLTGLRAGLDIARGPEDWAYYITIGSAWTSF
jgi:hypothetical protein